MTGLGGAGTSSSSTSSPHPPPASGSSSDILPLWRYRRVCLGRRAAVSAASGGGAVGGALDAGPCLGRGDAGAGFGGDSIWGCRALYGWCGMASASAGSSGAPAGGTSSSSAAVGDCIRSTHALSRIGRVSLRLTAPPWPLRPSAVHRQPCRLLLAADNQFVHENWPPEDPGGELLRPSNRTGRNGCTAVAAPSPHAAAGAPPVVVVAPPAHRGVAVRREQVPASLAGLGGTRQDCARDAPRCAVLRHRARASPGFKPHIAFCNDHARAAGSARRVSEGHGAG